MPACLNCGAEFAPSDVYCSRCGRPLGAPPTYPLAPPYPYYPPPKQDNTALIIVLVVVLVIAVPMILSAVLYLMVSGPISPPGGPPGPITFDVVLTKSADGANWTLSFVRVPPGLSPNATYLQLSTAGGTTALPRTPLSSLPGGLVMLTNGSVYIRYQGVRPRTISVGDTVRIGIALAGSNMSTVGYHYLISSGNVASAGTLG